MECIEAYLPLEGPHLDEYRQLLITKDYEMARILGKTSYELGVEDGSLRGQRKVLSRQIETRFGTMTETNRERLEAMTDEQLAELGIHLIGATSLEALGLE